MAGANEGVISSDDSLCAAVYEMCPVSTAWVVTLCPLSNYEGQTVFQLPWLKLMADTAFVIVRHLLISIGVGVDADSRWTRAGSHCTRRLDCFALVGTLEDFVR